uniref:glucuronosyltransferase n=1 Tax=Meloidogyne javanica TaxID=6303 RepID=A0A915LWK2_MELJA
MSVDLFGKYLNVFKSFENYSFIWKFDYDDKNQDPKREIGIPENVKIQEGYIQQTTLLANESTKAMITHCGYNSLLEGVYFQIPMVCIPNNSDQPYNAYAAESRGYVEEVDFRDENLEVHLKNALGKVLNDEDWKYEFKGNTNELNGIMNESKGKFIQAMKEMIGNM